MKYTLWVKPSADNLDDPVSHANPFVLVLSWSYWQLWSRIGKRPWTFISRDWTHEHPLIIILIALGVGLVLGHFYWSD